SGGRRLAAPPATILRGCRRSRPLAAHRTPPTRPHPTTAARRRGLVRSLTPRQISSGAPVRPASSPPRNNRPRRGAAPKRIGATHPKEAQWPRPGRQCCSGLREEEDRYPARVTGGVALASKSRRRE